MDSVGVFLFNDVELLDFAGPYEVFSKASDSGGRRLFNVFTVSQVGGEVRSANGLRVNSDHSFAVHPAIDILGIPGGVGTRSEVANAETLAWVGGVYESSKLTMTVCSGALLPAKLGLLNGLESTTHHDVIAYLRAVAPHTIVRGDKRFVDNGKIMTAGGISAGIDLALHVVGKLHGRSTADNARIYMEYGNWRDAVPEGD